MRTLALALLGLLGLLCVGLGAERLRPWVLVEPGAAPPGGLAPGLVERLAALEGPLLVTRLRSPIEDLPADLRAGEPHVAEALERLARASDGRLRHQLLDPDADGTLGTLVRALGAEPFRARRILADGWSEVAVWSHLGLAAGDTPTRWLHGLAPGSVDEAARWIVAGLEEVARPRRARVALVVGDGEPADGDRLGELLSEAAELTRAGSILAPAVRDSDLLLWLPGAGVDGEELDALERRAREGRSTVIAASPCRAREQGDQLLVESAPDLAPLFDALGLEVDPGLRIDAVCASAPGPGSSERPLPWRVRSLASAHDFRSLGREPGGPLELASASGLGPRPAVLDAARRRAHVLASGSPASRVLPPGTHAVSGLVGEDLVPGAPAALMVHLESLDPLAGDLVVSTSTTPFAEPDAPAHRALVLGLVRDLVPLAARVRTRVLGEAAPVPVPPRPGTLLAWRTAYLAVALLLLLSPLRRPGSRALAARVLGLAGGGALLVLALGTVAARLPRMAADWTRGASHSLPPAARDALELATVLADDPVRIELVTSAEARLPLDWREPLARLRATARDLARSPGVELRERRVGPGDAGDLAPLRVPVRVGATTEVREVHARVTLARGEQRIVLRPGDAASLERAEVRLVVELGRLLGREPAPVVLAADVPRLSPAEALLEYQRQGRFAPVEGDVHGAARRLLGEVGLAVRELDPNRPGPVAPHEVLVWLQPRREVGPMLERLRAHLAAGGRALVAAQQFEVQGRRLDGPDGPLSFWPRPLFPDIDEVWLSTLGVELRRAVVLDARSVHEEGARGATAGAERPFLLREAALERPDHPWTAGLGDLFLPSPTAIDLDPARLTSLGLRARTLLRTSNAARALPWEGGALDPGDLAPPAPGAAGSEGPLPLAVDLEGPFAPGAPAGRLLLVGCSAAFRDEALGRPALDNGAALAGLVLGLAGGDELASLAARRALAPGLPELPANGRLALRAAATAAGPLAVLLLVALVRRRRAAGGVA